MALHLLMEFLQVTAADIESQPAANLRGQSVLSMRAPSSQQYPLVLFQVHAGLLCDSDCRRRPRACTRTICTLRATRFASLSMLHFSHARSKKTLHLRPSRAVDSSEEMTPFNEELLSLIEYRIAATHPREVDSAVKTHAISGIERGKRFSHKSRPGLTIRTSVCSPWEV
ncbi:hypothetical protein L226DRAFT_375842 [Lentinus tigrinus ALCF2SS1-7]|uniref:Uncharacterized protein n=1 Tax=Lentinus tigrinus ALCF2SS1-6 TaxID=1328759 RepID=A0A5C2SLN6_9APHY|nr:hypothetical protein L227DRAFT_321468 [Lentinus tigrinus ALCF2SS1-6]RPD76418.1 hypothetical protein L226DRAFT_375842 [Lentinus tigrinus ALCF2SS1-7]